MLFFKVILINLFAVSLIGSNLPTSMAIAAQAGIPQTVQCAKAARLMQGQVIPNFADLPTFVASKSGSYQSYDAAELEKTLAPLRQSMVNLENRFRQEGQTYWKSWETYLRWVEFKELLKKDQFEAGDTRLLQVVELQFAKLNAAQKRNVWVIDVRARLETFLNTFALVLAEVSETEFQKKLQELANALQVTDPAERRRQTSDAVFWLQLARQVPEVTATVYCYYSYDNFKLAASERFIGKGINQEVSDVSQVRDYFLGASIGGSALTSGQIRADLVPNSEYAQVDIVFNGQTTSRTSSTAYRRGMFRTRSYTVWSNSTSNIAAKKSIFVSSEGISSALSSAVVNTSVNPYAIGGSRLGRNIAWRRALGARSQAAGRANWQVANQINSKLNSELKEPLGKAEKDFDKMFRAPLVEVQSFPERMRYSSSNDQLFIRLLQANEKQLGAEKPAPEFKEDGDLVFRINESFATNYASALYGGKKVKDSDVAIFIADFIGDVPAELDTSDIFATPWSFEFVETRPIEYSFQNGLIQLSYRANGVNYDEQDKDISFYAVGTFKPEVKGDGVVYHRQGDVQIQFGGDDAADEEVVAFLKEKLNAMFFKELDKSTGLELAGDWENKAEFRLKDMRLEDGWLQYSWELKGEN